jgi:hypothetical protein
MVAILNHTPGMQSLSHEAYHFFGDMDHSLNRCPLRLGSWSNGVLEEWFRPNTPSLHYSNTPFF